jgi:hypothetical protein
MQLLLRLAGAFSGVWGYAAAAALSAIVAGTGMGWTVHRIDQAAYAALQLAGAKAKNDTLAALARTDQREAKANLDAAVAEAQAQQKIVTETVTVTKEIAQHVPIATPCIPFGLVRVLDDAATGSDTAGAPTPVGQPDDACAPLSWRAVASELSDDYAGGRANAEQLNALEADVRALAAAANETPARDGDGK